MCFLLQQDLSDFFHQQWHLSGPHLSVQFEIIASLIRTPRPQLRFEFVEDFSLASSTVQGAISYPILDKWSAGFRRQ